MYCQNCGEEINDKAVICVNCGVATEKYNANTPTAQTEKKSGTPGVVGFVLALFSLFLPIPYLDIVLGVAAFVISLVGVMGNRSKKGLAIAGIVISIIAVIGAINLLMIGDMSFYQYYYYN